MKIKEKKETLNFFKKPSKDFLSKVLSDTFVKDKTFIYTLITTLATCFICYFYEMIHGLGCPDTLCEGLRTYRNADFSTSQARWMLRFINEFFGKNVIIPTVTVISYCLMIGVSAFIICRMMRINKASYVVIITATMVSFPIILHQFAYLYMALAYSFSFLMVVCASYLTRTHKIIFFAVSIIFHLMMMGSYQSYIGAATALAIVMFIFDLIDTDSIKKAFINLGLAAASLAGGALINMPFSRFMMNHYHTGMDERVSAFSIAPIFENLGFSLKFSYVWFFSYFNNEILSRNRFYFILFLALILLAISIIVGKILKKQYGVAALILLGFLLLPIGMNFLLVLMPSNGMRDILRYQYVLIFPLLIMLHDKLDGLLYTSILKVLSHAAIAFILIANVISANSTALMYKYSYEDAINQANFMMNKVYDLEDYVANETPIILTGPISYSALQDKYPKIFRYAEVEGGPVFWNDFYGMNICRYQFFQDFIGVNPQYITREDFSVVDSEEFKEMPVWPLTGSVKMIDGKVVIKTSDNPPEY
ncbi:MAG: glucosyltransferase domain-containing protein [Lachnospiraceae bacterium]|nr:glucosyltransferase domain-containing protein [Lachnospiraceae bacterium]